MDPRKPVQSALVPPSVETDKRPRNRFGRLLEPAEIEYLRIRDMLQKQRDRLNKHRRDHEASPEYKQMIEKRNISKRQKRLLHLINNNVVDDDTTKEFKKYVDDEVKRMDHGKVAEFLAHIRSEHPWMVFLPPLFHKPSYSEVKPSPQLLEMIFKDSNEYKKMTPEQKRQHDLSHLSKDEL